MSDRDEPTPWEDINPPMALAARRGPQLPSSERLQPASNDTFRDELTACLALVAPVGMTEEARRDWLLVAWKSLSHLPDNILQMGCRAARQTCDHPSKIVPTIIAETKERMAWRIESARDHLALAPPIKRSVMDRRGQAMSQADTDELNGILENLGATARYRPDGSRYSIEAVA
jgi:hypothetical protein